MNFRPVAGAAAPAGYTMRANGKTGEIVLYSFIGSDLWGEGISATQFKKDLDALGGVTTINLRINSPGGQVFDGLTIFNLLAQHSAQIVTHIDGLAASIASVIAMAGNEIRIADTAMMMIHNAAGIVFGGAKEMRETADLLDTISATVCGTYCKRSGQSVEMMTGLMNAETWMTAQQAADLGLVDMIVPAMDIAASAIDRRFQYRNTPASMMQPAPEPPPILGARPNVDRYAQRLQGLRVQALRAGRP